MRKKRRRSQKSGNTVAHEGPHLANWVWNCPCHTFDLQRNPEFPHSVLPLSIYRSLFMCWWETLEPSNLHIHATWCWRLIHGPAFTLIAMAAACSFLRLVTDNSMENTLPHYLLHTCAAPLSAMATTAFLTECTPSGTSTTWHYDRGNFLAIDSGLVMSYHTM